MGQPALKDLFLAALSEIRLLREKLKDDPTLDTSFSANVDDYADVLNQCATEVQVAAQAAVEEESRAHILRTTPRKDEAQEEKIDDRSYVVTVDSLEEELNATRALLLLKNVNLSPSRGNADNDTVDIGLSFGRGHQGLIKALLILQQKVKLLQQQYLLLRGDMVYLNQEMHVGIKWVMSSFKGAMCSQLQEHNSLQVRLERLAKVLN
eukprot:GEMP01053453.1.p1 GENE.GEMP01053453.1~~GEMP01053453.1.p1  ORF type:complete len:208 (+),score=53.02 GEMP01053453.1:42-665(+)